MTAFDDLIKDPIVRYCKRKWGWRWWLHFFSVRKQFIAYLHDKDKKFFDLWKYDEADR